MKRNEAEMRMAYQIESTDPTQNERRPEETKKRCKPAKMACSDAFWRPRGDSNTRPTA